MGITFFVFCKTNEMKRGEPQYDLHWVYIMFNVCI